MPRSPQSCFSTLSATRSSYNPGTCRCRLGPSGSAPSVLSFPSTDALRRQEWSHHRSHRGPVGTGSFGSSPTCPGTASPRAGADTGPARERFPRGAGRGRPAQGARQGQARLLWEDSGDLRGAQGAPLSVGRAGLCPPTPTLHQFT